MQTGRRREFLWSAAFLTMVLGVVPVRVTASAPVRSPAQDSLRFGRFGWVALYRNSPHPARVVLFVSGDGGWNLGVVQMASELAALDALVVGIDIRTYLKALALSAEPVSTPAVDFEALSHFVQKATGAADYATPVLAGYSSGATLVYATLAQAPPGTFAGAMSLGFCPDLPLSRPLARGNGLAFEPGPKGKGYSFLPSQNLAAPWVVFQGEQDQVCNPGVTRAFAAATPGADLVMLPRVGHGFGVPANWLPQLREAFERVIARNAPDRPPPGAVGDLPIVEIPAGPGARERDLFAVLWSGDGGWAGLDRDVGGALADAGVPVVGVNSLRYFWQRRSPEEASRDLERIVRHYRSAWSRDHVVLVGYSFGADVLPFLVARLPEDLRRSLRAVVLLGPSGTAEFEFHIGDWLGREGAGGLPTLPEIRRLAGIPVLCFKGDLEVGSLCDRLEAGQATTVILPGGHHLGGHYGEIARRILAAAAAP